MNLTLSVSLGFSFTYCALYPAVLIMSHVGFRPSVTWIQHFRRGFSISFLEITGIQRQSFS